MKKQIRFCSVLFLAIAFMLAGCNKDLKDDIKDLKKQVEEANNRLTSLEEGQRTANNDITNMKTLVTAVETADYVTSVTETAAGYTITFKNGKPITVSHGKPSDIVPMVGVKQDADSYYYWTVKYGAAAAEEWLLNAAGDKIRAGDGSGPATVAPQVRISSANAWEISTDGGATWTSTGVNALGTQGPQGQAGSNANSPVSSVGIDFDNGMVSFNLIGGSGAIVLPLDLGDGLSAATARKIYTATGLDSMRKHLDWHYLLMADITVTNWLPVGDGSTGSRFFGSFNGNGHTVTISSFGEVPKHGSQPVLITYYYGLFGVIDGGKVSKLHVAIGSAVGTVNKTDARIFYGGIAGQMQNSGALIENCSVSGDLAAKGASGFDIAVGGIIGNARFTIQNCYALGSVSATTTGTGVCYAGGIVGYIYSGSITACIALQTSITATGGGTNYSGRVAGYDGGLITDSYGNKDMLVNGNKPTADIGSDLKNGADCSSTDWSNIDWWYGDLGWDPAIWNFTDLGAAKYPKLR